MPSTDPAFWYDYLRHTLERYDEPLLRQVAAKLFKPRNQWPVDELIDRSVETAGNVAVIDRRLQDLGAAERRVLALIGHSRQPRWRLGNLLEMLAALGHAEGPRPIFALFEAGLLYPDLFTAGSPAAPLAGPIKADGAPRLRNFEQWLGQASATGFTVFAHPLVSGRALGEDLGLPDLSDCGLRIADCGLKEGKGQASQRSSANPQSAIRNPQSREADGLDWPLRLAILWQQVAGNPLRRTQQGDFFKRDLERLRGDPLLCAPPLDNLTDLPDVGLLTVALALLGGILHESEGELSAAALPADWDQGLFPALDSLWRSLPHLDAWDVAAGWHGSSSNGNPYPSAYLLALLLLTRLPKDSWANPEAVDRWIREHHPYWSASGRTARDGQAGDDHPPLAKFLLGFAYQLRLVQAAQGSEGEWLVRLAPVGRWLLGLDEVPATPAVYPQTLLVQPNLEIVVYRQGLTLSLLAQLSRFAAWKSLGAACTLQLQPDTVYRALESGETFASILRALEQHGMRSVPATVLDSLRTWADKRDRIAIYPSATLFEFANADDLNEALARGLPGVRVSERLAVVASESTVDFRHFRLTSTRDYGLPPEKCVDVEADGVTLAVDLTRSDLMVETELQRIAEPLDRAGQWAAERGAATRLFRLTPASLAAARDSGLSLRSLDEWFVQRSGRPLSAAARLLLIGSQLPPLELRRQLVLTVPSAEVADGLLQWPDTRGLIQARLGPTALGVAEEDAELLRQRLRTLGLNLQL